MMMDDATRRQVEAAHPGRSTWLSANAGSGKTRVLTDRVARLLLDGVPPDHILCLTYTKAAATEMQNRLFRRLGQWAMLTDDDLDEELGRLGVDVSGAVALRDARTLFARAIETPGGLRIQTIHSFCASLLRRFPLEAGVSPQFTEIEDRSAELLRQELLDNIAEGSNAIVLTEVARRDTDQTLDGLAAEVVSKRARFDPPLDEDGLRAAYGIAPDVTLDSLLAEMFFGDTLEFIAECAALCIGQGGKSDAAIGEILKRVQGRDLASLMALEEAVFTKSGTPRKALITKGFIGKAFGPMWARYESLGERVIAAREVRLALEAVQRDLALHRFAGVFLPAYEAEKLRRGWLDFDDLIERANALLRDPTVAAWVLFRLDGGIDHILVDEAQDTSPTQWSVIERLAQEFTSGEGARADIVRTIFVVGDKKQSIYSFQGADASEFDRMRAEFAARLDATDQPLQTLNLEFSFRSAEPILKLVDATFVGRDASGFQQEDKHRAFKNAMPGRVDLWPLVPKTDTPEKADWFEPVDYVSPQHHTVILAQRIARHIRQLIDAKHPLPLELGHSGQYQARPVQAGDFLILVRRRSRLFSEIIRACKKEGLPIAGADRLKVMAELAVRDIAALLSFLDTPEDNLSLAVALKSPLFGLNEQALFDLSHRRTNKFLWVALRERREEFPHVMAVLDDLMGQTDFLRPYDLIERILTRHDGRRRLLGRLGEEAEDGIDALLQQALAYERSSVPSLTGFLQWMQTDDLEIKREMEAGGGRIRVMTVHGSKGLEAPIVILPDCTAPRNRSTDSILNDEKGVFWRQSPNAQPERQRETVEDKKAVAAREFDRLLYVAMTRAECWLTVAAVDDLGKSGEDWYSQVLAGMQSVDAVPNRYDFGDLGAGDGLMLGQADWSDLTMSEAPQQAVATLSTPDWAVSHAASPERPAERLAPSALGGAKALPGAEGEDTQTAMARGTLIHMLLELLADVPDADRQALGHSLVAARGDDVEPVQATALVDEALRCLRHPQLAGLFSSSGLSEVDISGEISGLGPIGGVIDRLEIDGDVVRAVDFKTNRAVPANVASCPDGLLRQMGAYAALLSQIYPDHRIETGFLWTHTATYMGLPHDVVIAALKRAHLDVAAHET